MYYKYRISHNFSVQSAQHRQIWFLRVGLYALCIVYRKKIYVSGLFSKCMSTVLFFKHLHHTELGEDILGADRLCVEFQH